jgi:hypothetical protein
MRTSPHLPQRPRRRWHFCAALLLGCACSAAFAQDDPAATITLLTGQATAMGSTGVRSLNKGDAVYSGEIVNTGPATLLNLKFADGGLVLLRADTRFEIADFHDEDASGAPPAGDAPSADPQPAATQPTQSHAFLRLLRGGLRAVSGLIGHQHRDDYRMDTPVATIGIRGTDYEAVVCDSACAQDPVVAAALPAGSNAEGGVVTGVMHGRIVVGAQRPCPQADDRNEPAGCVALTADHYLLTTVDGRQIPLGQQPRFLRVDPLPDPHLCGG